MTQKERLLDWLQKDGPINPLLAWRRLGIYRLSSVIHILRKDGWNIKTNTIDVKNRYDETCHVAEYVLMTGSGSKASLLPELIGKSARSMIIDDPVKGLNPIAKAFLNSAKKESEQMDLGL